MTSSKGTRKIIATLCNRAYLPAWLALAGLLIAAVLATRQEHTIRMQEMRATVQNEASLIRSRLEGHISADMQLISGLVAVLATHPDMDQQRFNEIAARVIGDRAEFLNIAVAPDLVVRMVYPFEPNKSVLGLDYNKNEAQRSAAQRVRDSGEMVLAGPVNLVQGGQGFIGRFPIFAEIDGERRFTGLISAVLEVEHIYGATGLLSPNLPIQLALAGRDGTGSEGEIFFGEPWVFAADPVLMDIVLPTGTWRLAAIPQGGWSIGPDDPWLLRLLLMGIGALIVVPTFLACQLAYIRRNVIEKLREHEKELQEKQVEMQLLSEVAQNASDGIVLTDSDARIIWANRAFSQMTGYSTEELLGHTPGDLLNGPMTDPAGIKAIMEHRSRGEQIQIEVLNYTKSGDQIWVDTRLVPLLDDDGAVTMVIGVERDVTANKRHEQELAEAKLAAEEADRAKSEFLANMSHEIRTPMNGIIGMAEVLAEAQLNPDDMQCVETIRDSSEALLKIINDILDLSRLESGKLSITDTDFVLKSCIDSVVEVLRLAAKEKGLPLEVEYGDDLPEIVRTDDGRLRQILLNLLGNAVKFTDAGKVALRIGRGPDNPLDVVFEVSDTGIGLTEDEVGRIFDRFSQSDSATTRAYGGTGLGLTISRHLAEQMGGGISVISEPDKGSCFTLSIQTKAPSDTLGPGDAPKSFDVAVLHGRKVLLAEDNRTNRLLIQKYLASVPIDLIEAENGRQAIEMFIQHRPDIVLMDMSMPEMDGVSASREIRRLPVPQPPIIALTANAYPNHRQTCLEAGMNLFLSKPINKYELFKAMVDALENDGREGLTASANLRPTA